MKDTMAYICSMYSQFRQTSASTWGGNSNDDYEHGKDDNDDDCNVALSTTDFRLRSDKLLQYSYLKQNNKWIQYNTIMGFIEHCLRSVQER